MDNTKNRFLSPNEPLIPQGIDRILSSLEELVSKFQEKVGSGRNRTITLWDPNLSYDKNDVVVYFKTEQNQVSVESGKREFVFILVSKSDGNRKIPNYDLVDGIPDFTKSDWKLLNPMTYLLQDLVQMKNVVVEVVKSILDEHTRNEHRLDGAAEDIEQSLVKKDFSNLNTSGKGKFTIATSDNGQTKLFSNGVMECFIKYSFDEKANNTDYTIKNPIHYLKKSPIWDESDQTIFTRKYVEDNLFSVSLSNGTKFNNLRYGTNIFHKHIQFQTPFVNDEYCVFFDTYGNGSFVFGFNKEDLMEKTEPTYDAIVSMPMIMGKTASGFDIVLPIHTHFYSLKKYKVGIPWNNEFNLQVIGRYR